MPALQLDQEGVRDLVKSQGPCVTILLPPFVPGAQTVPPPATVLKNLLDEAEAVLTARNVNKRAIGDLLDPVKRLPEGPEWTKGCRWSRAIFRSTDKMGEFYLHERTDGRVSADERFDVLPILPELEMPQEFYVLKLSKKRASLMRAGFDLEPAPLPGQIPEKLDDFLALDVPDHDRENRAATSAGGRRVRFGTGSERETQRAYLHDFYRAIDRALMDLLTPRRPPLLLVGVDEDTSLYRSLSMYSNLLPRTIQGSPDGGMSDCEMLERSFATVKESAIQGAVAALDEARERLAPSRFSDDPKAIANFAAQGRVGHLFIAAPATDETLNAAAVETIRHGGVASAVPADRMQTPVAAALRF